MSSLFKHFIFFTRAQQIAILMLIIVILLGIAAIALFIPTAQESTIHEERKLQAEVIAFQEQMTSYDEMVKKRYYNDTIFARHPALPVVVLRPFDPNSADSLTLLSLGLKPWMVKNILKYRLQGGEFRTPEAFQRIYGITPELFATLAPYIEIDTLRLTPLEKGARDTLLYQSIELNSADTSQLKALRGIGPTLAMRIVSYRQRLGGYHNLEQLVEVDGIDVELLERISPYLCVERDSIKPIVLNRSSVERLRGHPYIDFYQAAAIYELRRNHRYLDSLPQLNILKELPPEWFDKMVPYLDFTIPEQPPTNRTKSSW